MRLLLERPVRMLAETRGLDALAAASDWLTKLEWGFTDAGDVRVNFDITVKDAVHQAVLVFPALFPDVPAYVRPRQDDQSWSSHQYRNGTLCLEWGPDNWHAGVTGVDLVNSTFRLLAYEEFGPVFGVEAPSRHELTLGQRTRMKNQRFITTRELVAAVVKVQSQPFTAMKVGTATRFGEFVGMVTKLGGEPLETLPDVPSEFSGLSSLGLWEREGWLVRCDEWESLPNTVDLQEDVRTFLKSKERWPWPDDEDRSAFLLLADDQLRLRALALNKTGNSTVSAYFVVDGDDDNAARQPTGNAALAGKKIAIVGLGSVGSKVAVSLARSGATDFLLVDDDTVRPANLVRNQLDWLSVGYDKVDAVKGAIQLVRPEADVRARSFRFAGQESSSFNTTVLEQVAACELVIDATASPSVFSSLAAICARRKVALVWGEVFAGGIGALMARSLPSRDADPLTVRAAVHAYLADKPEAPFKQALGYGVETEDQVFVAGDAEVSHLAATLTQLAIDTLTAAETPRFPVSAYLIGFQKAWIFEAPFDTHPVDAPRVEAEPIPREDVEANVSAFGELIDLMLDKKC